VAKEGSGREGVKGEDLEEEGNRQKEKDKEEEEGMRRKRKIRRNIWGREEAGEKKEFIDGTKTVRFRKEWGVEEENQKEKQENEEGKEFKEVQRIERKKKKVKNRRMTGRKSINLKRRGKSWRRGNNW
jgi:hypothetical protein